MNWRLHACFEGFVVQGEEYALEDVGHVPREQGVESARSTFFSWFHGDQRMHVDPTMFQRRKPPKGKGNGND